MMSCAATQLLPSLVERTGLARDRISIRRLQSVEWQSLTFTGERHEISLLINGPDSEAALGLLRNGLSEAIWSLQSHVVADILIVGEQLMNDGSIRVEIEALTLSD